MSPSKFQDLDHHHMTKNVYNNPNPSNSQLRSINKESHSIQKPMNNNPLPRSTRNPSSTGSSAKRPPVIIYSHPPKIIETNAHEFMALVQNLTGMSKEEKPPPVTVKTERDSRDEEEYNNLQHQQSYNNMHQQHYLGLEEKESTSRFMGVDDQCKFAGGDCWYNQFIGQDLPPFPGSDFASTPSTSTGFQYQKLENYSSCPVSPMNYLNINADYQSNNFGEDLLEYQNNYFP